MMSLLIAALFVCAPAAGAFATPASAETASVAGPVTEADFIAAGWPADYASKLAELKKQHPSWTFEKLDVTGMSDGKYTWDYILKMECDDNPKRNLVGSGDAYVVLRDFRDANLYDSGWYKASKYTVSYFMDSRNFLDEEQIFQFADLGWSESVTVDMVKTVLRGTFMENACLDDIYSDMTYADFFMYAGRETGANPVYLAVLVRSEQGTAGTSALIGGTIGDRLWYYYSNGITGTENGKLINAPTSGWTEEALKKYNGYYNYFNIGASGTGYFQIYRGGAEEAMKGSPEFAEAWGGNPAWNTRWKAILGGALRATSKYVNDYQNTFYLQKFNVDPRSSRNFWGQYMQSIFGSQGRAASMYKSYKEGGVLDMPYRFLIPVYSGMPESPSKYPDGTELADPRPVTSANVESYEFLDLGRVKSFRAKSGIASEKISWRCLASKTGEAIPLGQIDLSGWSSAVIEYSVAEKFDSFAGNKPSYLALTSDSGTPAEDDGSASLLARGRLADGTAGGFLFRRNMTLDLKDVSFSGEVYLTGSLAEGQQYVIHNIVLIKKQGYEAATAPETAEATDASAAEETATAAPETSEAEGSSPTGGCSSSLALPAAAAFTAAAAATSKAAAGHRRRRKK